MGYYIRISETNFEIPSENKQDAFIAIKQLMEDDSAKRSGGTQTFDGHTSYFAYLNNAEPDLWNNLSDAMSDWRFPIDVNDEQDVVDISFSGEKFGDEKQMFERIAPFVKTGSYIEFVGDEGEKWRIEFTDESCDTVTL